MRHEAFSTGKRKAVNVTLDTGIVAAAREMGINISRVSETAIRAATQLAVEQRWRDDNRAWAEAHNEWVEDHALPLERYRLF